MGAVAASEPASPGPGTFDLYYNTPWSPAYLHFNNGNGWNSIPGAAMAPSTVSHYAQLLRARDDRPLRKLRPRQQEGRALLRRAVG